MFCDKNCWGTDVCCAGVMCEIVGAAGGVIDGDGGGATILWDEREDVIADEMIGRACESDAVDGVGGERETSGFEGVEAGAQGFGGDAAVFGECGQRDGVGSEEAEDGGVHSISGIDFHGDINGGGGVGESADGDEVDAGFSDCGDGLEVHATACFELEFALVEVDGLAELVECHVIEEDDIDVGKGEEAFDLFEGIGFEFDAGGGVIGFEAEDAFAELVERIGCEVIVFDHDHVVEADSVVGAAAGEDGLFFEEAQSWGSFAGVEDPRLGMGDGLDVLVGEGGDAGQALEEVERGAFCGEEGICGGLDGEDGGVSGGVGSVGRDEADVGVRAHAAEDFGGGVCACDDAGLFGEKARGGGGGVGEIGGGEIALTDVLVEGVGDGVMGGE